MIISVKSEIPNWVEKTVDLAEEATVDQFKDEVSKLISIPKEFINLSVQGVSLDKGKLKDYKEQLISGRVYFSYARNVFA